VAEEVVRLAGHSGGVGELRESLVEVAAGRQPGAGPELEPALEVIDVRGRVTRLLQAIDQLFRLAGLVGIQQQVGHAQRRARFCRALAGSRATAALLRRDGARGFRAARRPT
jgi:hypothetical protein